MGEEPSDMNLIDFEVIFDTENFRLFNLVLKIEIMGFFISIFAQNLR